MIYQACVTLKHLRFYGVFTLLYSDSYADSFTKKITMNVKVMAQRSVLKGAEPICLSLHLGLGPVETLLNIIIKLNSLCLGLGIDLGIGVWQCKWAFTGSVMYSYCFDDVTTIFLLGHYLVIHRILVPVLSSLMRNLFSCHIENPERFTRRLHRQGTSIPMFATQALCG